MYRWLALLALSPLVGCHTPAQPPKTNIDSFQNAYFSGRPIAPPAQVAAAPADQSPAPRDVAPANDQPRTAAPPAAVSAPARAPRYKASVAAYIKRYAVDASSLKQAKIGTPFEGSVNGQKGSVVCVELDGIKADRTAYLLQNDAVVDSEYGADVCQNQQLAPWNERGS